MTMPTMPITRDLRTTTEALAIAEAEFGFQAERLKITVAALPSSAQEHGHLLDMLAGYMIASRYAGILHRYHVGRAARVGGAASGGRVDAVGRMDAVVDDADTPA